MGIHCLIERVDKTDMEMYDKTSVLTEIIMNESVTNKIRKQVPTSHQIASRLSPLISCRRNVDQRPRSVCPYLMYRWHIDELVLSQ